MNVISPGLLIKTADLIVTIMLYLLNFIFHKSTYHSTSPILNFFLVSLILFESILPKSRLFAHFVSFPYHQYSEQSLEHSRFSRNCG